MYRFDFTLDKFKKCLPHCKDPATWFVAVYDTLLDYDINTIHRVAGFLAQTQHESQDFNILRENLNYSSQSLRRVFKKYFPTVQLADSYARKPEQIANKVYANRMGNGNEESGDGWRFKGRGILQVTGKNNYTKVSKHCFGDDTLLINPDKLCEPEWAIKSACWYWDANGLNNYCDELDIKGMSKRVNGGYIGLDDRIAHWSNNIAILKGIK